MKTPELITDQGDFESHCRRWRRAGRFAFDTEFIRDDTFDAHLCLVQAATDGEVVLIDPTAGLDMSPFWALVTDEKVTTVVHAGKEDFEVCLRATGKAPRNIFDVQIAAGFAGFDYPLSLSRLVNVLLQKRIAKGQTLTDWMRRPLTDNQLHYAVEDVTHLPDIYDALTERLARSGRTAWAREEFATFEDPTLYRKPAEQRLFKLKGAKRLDGLSLALLERLIEWRDRWAQARNRPIRSLIRDDILVTIAKRRPKAASDLEVMRGFPQSRRSLMANEVLEIIRETESMPEAQRPRPHVPREDTPMTRAALSILSGFVRAVCHEEGVAHDLVGSTQRLNDLIDYLLGQTETVPLLLTGWREEFIGRRLVALLEGRSELHLSGWPNNLRLATVTHKSKRPAGAIRQRARKPARKSTKST